MVYFKNTGDLVLKTGANKGLENVMPIVEEMGISYLDYTNEEMKHCFSNPDFKSYYPKKNHG